MKCTIHGCENKHEAKGFCAMHYRRMKAHGDANVCLTRHFKNDEKRRECSAIGCGSMEKSKGYCDKHYGNYRRNGHPYNPRELHDIFLDWVVSNPTNKCIEWPFALKDTGYGLYMRTTAHRRALILLTGEDPKNLEAAHGPCHNRACVNPHPEHGMSWKTSKENNSDKARDGTHLTGENTPVYKHKDAEIINAYFMYANGVLLREIERVTGINESTIRGVARGKHRKHLGLPVLPNRSKTIKRNERKFA